MSDKENYILVDPIETGQVQAETNLAVAILSDAEKMEIATRPQYESAADMLKDVKAKAKDLNGRRKDITRPLDKAKKQIMDLFRAPLDKLGKAEKILKRSMNDYVQEQERIRREKEEKLRREAEAERRRKGEQQRRWEEKEKKRREEADRLEAEGKAEEARKAKAAAEKAAGKAEERALEVENVQAPVLAQEDTPKGVSYRSKWTAEVVDLSQVPLQYLEPNMSMLNRMAQATKGKVSIPGVKFHEEKIVASTSR
jgi:chromosome segregation ATPase